MVVCAFKKKRTLIWLYIRASPGIHNILTMYLIIVFALFVYLSIGHPVFESHLCDHAAKIGQTIKLTCKVSGSPQPIISWIKGLEYSHAGFAFIFHSIHQQDMHPVNFFNLIVYLPSKIFVKSKQNHTMHSIVWLAWWFHNKTPMTTSQTVFLWRMIRVTSSPPTGQEHVVSSWTASLLRTLDSMRATLPTQWAMLALWRRWLCRVRLQLRFAP